MAEIPPPNSSAYRETSDRLRRNGGSGGTDDERSEPVVRLYVCPTEGCGSYYGSSSMGDLSKGEKRSITGEPRGTRTECPRCGVEREERYARLVPKAEVEAARRKAEAAAPRTRRRLAASARRRRDG